MIRVRGPLGTLRVLLKPGERPWSGEEAPAATIPTEPGEPATSAMLPSDAVCGASHVG